MLFSDLCPVGLPSRTLLNFCLNSIWPPVSPISVKQMQMEVMGEGVGGGAGGSGGDGRERWVIGKKGGKEKEKEENKKKGEGEKEWEGRR